MSFYSFFLFVLRQPPRSTLFPTRRSSDLETTSEFLIEGSATLTIETSSTVMNIATQTSASASQRLGSAGDIRLLSTVCRSEEHTSELQSRRDLVCRLLLEKKKKNNSSNSQ